MFPIMWVWPRCSDFQGELWRSRLSRNKPIPVDEYTALFIQHAEQIIYHVAIDVAL